MTENKRTGSIRIATKNTPLHRGNRAYTWTFLPPASIVLVAIVAIVLLGFALHAASEVPRLPGFPPDSSQEELNIESQYQSLASSDQIQKFHRYLTAEPHPAGSARNNELARWVAEQWTEQGLEDVTIREYDVLNSNPRAVSLEMLSPVYYRASLREAPYAVDPDTRNPNISPAFLGYSASGDVTAPVVYAHNGDPEDYAFLKRHGIRVRGKIVLVRYSNPYSYRGFKAYTAQKEGAAGILIYSDPAEDGYRQGLAYPYGPWGPESHIQRGAITYDFLEPGDPLTPGWPSLPGAKRIPISQATTLPKIMALPLSWHDARPLLEKLDGPEAPLTWQGGLPLRYRLGGKRVLVHMKVDMDTRIQPYYVTEAHIRGSEFPDQWVILGNHRDAWVFGGVDPSSGTASMMEMTRNLGQLLKEGIRPRRTIVVCSWDGEEYALTGSTEWGEQFANELRQKAVAYLNVDSATSGPDFHGTTVASLGSLLVDVSRTVTAPGGAPLYDAWKNTRQRELAEGRAPSDSDLPDVQIGSGSDHTVFLNFLGIPVMNLEFDGPYGVYHSAYDDYYWMNHFGDPGYRYHALMTKLWGTLALRLANAEIIPYDFDEYAAAIRRFTLDLSDRTHAGSHMDLTGLMLRISEFETAGREFRLSAAAAISDGLLKPDEAARVDELLIQVERNWCNPQGIPGRPWFKHTIYGARYTYAHLELPGITEAAEAGDWDRATEQQQILENELVKNTALLREAQSELDIPNPPVRPPAGH